MVNNSVLKHIGNLFLPQKPIVPLSCEFYEAEDKDEFIKVTPKKAKKSGRAVSKARLFQRLYRLTNYLEPVSDKSLSEEDSM